MENSNFRPDQIKMIDEIIENFDFQKCQIAMKKLNWVWAGVGVPTIQDLKKSAYNRMCNAIKSAQESKFSSTGEPFSVSSGGLKATVYKNRYNRVNHMTLEFVLCDWDSDGD